MRSSAGSARPATTSRRSPTSRARPRMAELLRRTARQHAPGAPTSFRIYWRDETIVLDPGLLGRLRRQLMSQGRRNRQLPRVAKTLLDAMWRQVKGERGRERGREAFDDDMLGHDGFVEFASAWWPPLDAPTVLRLAARARVPRPRGRGRHHPRGAAAAHQVVGRRATCRSRTCPLLDELRYALGDVPQRTDDERDLDETGLLEGGVDLQELTTISEREYAPGGLAWSAADPPDRGRRLRPRPHRRGAGPHADAVADGRSPRPRRELDDRRRPRAVVVARRPRGRPRPAPRRWRARSSTSSTSPPTTATPPRSTPSPPTTPAASASTPTCPTPYAARARSRRSSVRVDDLEAAVRDAVAATVRPGRGHRRHRRTGRPPLRGQRLAGVVARVRRDAAGARAAVDSSVTPSGEDRIVVLTGPRHQGPGVRRHRGGLARRRSRTSRPPAGRPSTSC